MIPVSITLFALSFVMFSSLLFLAMMRMNPPMRSLISAELGVSRYEGRGRNRRRLSSEDDDEEEVDCAVCLGRLKVGDEIKELGCDHVFHLACFDRWAGHCSYASCPLCRRLTRSAEVVFDEDGVEVLTFRSWGVGNRDSRSNWWLR